MKYLLKILLTILYYVLFIPFAAIIEATFMGLSLLWHFRLPKTLEKTKYYPWRETKENIKGRPPGIMESWSKAWKDTKTEERDQRKHKGSSS